MKLLQKNVVLVIKIPKYIKMSIRGFLTWNDSKSTAKLHNVYYRKYIQNFV